MPLKSRVKGNQFEALAVQLLTELVKNSSWKRVPGSGAFGTSMHEPHLLGDIVGHVDSFQKPFRVEAKVGYNSASDTREVKQFTLKKEWLDKIKQEGVNSYSFPFLIGKFSGARDGVKVFVVMDLEQFADLLNKVTELSNEE
jgi:hypothetical protein